MTPNSNIWITGVGAVTSLGHEYGTIAENLLAGKSGVTAVKGFDVSAHPSQVAGQVHEVPQLAAADFPEYATLGRLEQVVLWCCTQALRDAGWWDKRQDVRMGLVLGLGSEWQSKWEGDALRGGIGVYEPHQDQKALVNAARQRLILHGPAATVSAACASSNYALWVARQWLRLGWVDVCLAGGCDMSVAPMSLAGFGNLRALSRRNNSPAAASRPFDKGRDGFVMGEGGAVFVLESDKLARERAAKVYAEIAGVSARSDAYHMIIPNPDPAPAAEAMKQALKDAQINPSEVDYVNAHATSTPIGDVCESRALQKCLGENVRTTPVSSTKSMTGHLLSAAAAVETLFCLIALDRQAVPPTINLDEPDPDCDLCHVPHQAQPRKLRTVVSNSFGFGGSNTCLVLKAA
jgi:3-oxoacyl-[acyl-carrier-protein] synthase II